MSGVWWRAVMLALAVQGAACSSVAGAQAAAVGVPAGVLASGTVVLVTLDGDLSTATNAVGDVFAVTVQQDVRDGDRIAIPAGTHGQGAVTFVTRRGGFGKAGIIGIALRRLDIGGRAILLDGRYREEGRGNGNAVVATWMVAGILSGVIKGRDIAIPKGRVLKARTGEEFAYATPNEAAPLPGGAATMPVTRIGD